MAKIIIIAAGLLLVRVLLDTPIAILRMKIAKMAVMMQPIGREYAGVSCLVAEQLAKTPLLTWWCERSVAEAAIAYEQAKEQREEWEERNYWW